jgi:hypothetical protein
VTNHGRSGDIQIEAPLARHPDVQRAVEDRSYIVFFGGALFSALGGGFLLAIALSLLLAGRIDWPQNSLGLTQAHGWAQLQGWAGLFVAGMSIRLLPRFAGRKPIAAPINIAVFVLLFLGVGGRTIAQALFEGGTAGALILASNTLAALGTAAVAAIIAWTLARGRRKPEAWYAFAWAGAAWWAAWAILLLKSGAEARDTGFVPVRLDDAIAWAIMLGAIANFIWSVQSRSVPIFFGRKQPRLRVLMAPCILLNAGAAAVLLSSSLDAGTDTTRLYGAGLAISGAALLWLAPVAGATWGRASRLRPRARAAARYVLAANIAGLAAGLLLLWMGVATVASGDLEYAYLRDAARHAIGLGLITSLIFGMARLVAPVFALERAESRGPDWIDIAAFWAIVAAIILRTAAALLADATDIGPRMDSAAASGIFAWLAIALFAVSVARAIRREPAMRELLVAPARGNPGD